MSKKKNEKKRKIKILWAKQTSFLAPFSLVWRSSSKKHRKNELKTCFEQNFTTGSYEVGIGRAWYSRIAC
jgi:hypothetical protein